MRILLSILIFSLATSTFAADRKADPRAHLGDSRGDRLLADYFEAETERLTDACFAEIQTKEDWLTRKDEYRRQLYEMLGLDPLPEKTPLEPVITGTIEHDGFIVEKIQFQSRPGLYVTGNLYRPKEIAAGARLPAILYVCGHGASKKGDISFGNKVSYQHHGAWFARNGYVCLTIDTLQMGEIEGIHHGTHRYGMWWWPTRGYTPAGVEAWNCIRALDYLETRPEVDADRFGVTGRSGGGAYSWWIAAIDERIKAAVPVAGITDLEDHVVDGCIEGHCDCMFQVNTYRWDYPMIAALVAPRALLISNTDKDPIFPLDGVVDVYQKSRKIYELLGARDKIGLQITEGGHKDTQELRIHAFVWFDRFLKNEPRDIEMAAVKFFEPEQLRVFKELPADERNTKIQESFTVVAETPAVPKSAEEWAADRDEWRKVLREKSFRGWPASSSQQPLELKKAFTAEHDGVQLSAYDFESQEHVPLRLYVAHRAGLKVSELDLVVLNALDDEGWKKFLATMRVGFEKPLAGVQLPEADADEFASTAKMFKAFKWGMAYVAPRGIGPTEWNRDEKKRVQIRRRFLLLGQTQEGMRVYDVMRAAQALRQVEGLKDVPLWMQGEREMAGITLYAALFTDNVKRLDLHNLPKSHQEGPSLLNVLRYFDMPQAVAMAAERSQVRLYEDEAGGWQYPQDVAKSLGWDEKQIQVRVAKPDAAAGK